MSVMLTAIEEPAKKTGADQQCRVEKIGGDSVGMICQIQLVSAPDRNQARDIAITRSETPVKAFPTGCSR